MDLASPTAALRCQLAAQLRERQTDLLGLLHGAHGAPGDGRPEVSDFKDLAAQEIRAQVDEVAHAHAAAELAQIAAALHRVDAGTYGQCEDCGEPIDERRLRALPATPYCTACQALRERPVLQRR